MGRDPGKPATRWTRHAGVGVEFAAAVAGLALLGYWIDLRYETAPWGVLIGAGLGLIGGTYNLLRESIAAFKRLDEEARKGKDEQGQD